MENDHILNRGFADFDWMPVFACRMLPCFPFSFFFFAVPGDQTFRRCRF